MKSPISVTDITDQTLLYQAHEKIYPREISGYFQQLRAATIGIILTIFYGLAWVDWNGHQAVLFDLPKRQFHIFSLTFWPQDFYLLTWLLIIGALSLFLATALAGRVWCGYACPQTVWTEIFLFFERLTEGHYRQRKTLDQAPWGPNKILRKISKQVLWIGFALLTGFTFVGYFTPIKTLANNIASFSLSGWEWFWLLFYGFATYGNAGFLREQVCQYLCPYARFQSAMLDKDSLVISYDQQRGEPRRGRKETNTNTTNTKTGDCINCNICVQVCPTGIDIRDGLQYECIGCAACIDACNQVMRKIGKPLGLIHYHSENRSQDSSSHSWFSALMRPRILIYSALWLLLVTGFVLFINQRPLISAEILKDRNSLYQVIGSDHIDNVYRLKLINKSQTLKDITITLKNTPGAQLLGPNQATQVNPHSMQNLALRVRMPLSNNSGPMSIHFVVSSKSEQLEIPSTFWFPFNEPR